MHETQIRDQRRKHWFWIDDAVIDTYAAQLGPGPLALYTILVRHADKDGKAYPGLERLQALLGGVAPNSVRKYREVLQQYGLITYERRLLPSGRDTTHIYTILPLPPKEGSTIESYTDGQHSTIEPSKTGEEGSTIESYTDGQHSTIEPSATGEEKSAPPSCEPCTSEQVSTFDARVQPLNPAQMGSIQILKGEGSMVEPQGIGFKELGRENPPNPPESAFAFEDSEKAHPDTPESPRPLPDFTQPPPEEPTPLDRAADRLIAQASAPRPPPKPCPEGHTMSAAIALCVRCDWRGLLEVFDPGDHAQRREPRMVMVLCTHQDTGISARHASLGYCLVSREERLDVMTGLRNGATP